MIGASSRVVLLDGGLGRELARRGVELPDTMWSGIALLTAPEMVAAVHRDYLEAGAEVITANTYTVTPSMVREAGMRNSEHDRLIGEAVRIARDAVTQVGCPARVAGSVGPAARSYRPDLLPSRSAIRELYEAQIAALLRTEVDIILGETLSSLIEAEVLLEVCTAAEVGELWVSFSLTSDGHLRTGQTLTDAGRAMIDNGVRVVLANCCAPDAVSKASGRGWPTAGQWGFYCNALADVPPEYSFADDGPLADRQLTPRAYAKFCAPYLNRGVSVIGGCCGIGPAHIAGLRDLIDLHYRVGASERG